MKHLVIFLGGYYPSYSAPGLVIEKMLPELKKHFRITVLTVRRTLHSLGNEFEFKNVHVIEHSYFLNDRVVESRFLKKRSFPFWRVLDKLLMMLRNGVETHTYNTRNALEALEQLYKCDPFSALLAVSFPVEALQAGALFKKAHQNIRFLSYSTDTWFQHPVLSLYPNKLLFCQRIVRKELNAYMDADYCYFSPEIFRNAREFLLSVLHKAASLNYLLLLPSEEAPVMADKKEIHIVYAGTFSRHFRNPKYFLEVLDFMLMNYRIRVCFDFYLVTHECSEMVVRLREKHPDSVFIHPPVSGEKINMIIRESDVLLNFSNDLDNFAPSKIFDYIATGRPIIDVIYKGRERNEVFKRYPALLEIVNPGDIEKDAERLVSYISTSEKNRVSFKTLADVYSEAMPSRVLSELIRKLKEV